MHRINRFAKFLLVAAASLGGTFSGIFQENLATALGKPASWIVVFAFLLILLIALQTIIENLIGRSLWLRKHLSGKSFVEGYWYDISRNESGFLTACACIYIYFEDEALKISGATLLLDDGMYGSWNATFATFEDHKLAYAFESHTSNSSSPIELGYAELKFTNGYRTPGSYSGFFFDTTHKSIITLEGRRIDDKSLIQSFEMPDGRYKFLCSIAKNAPRTRFLPVAVNPHQEAEAAVIDEDKP